MPKKQGAELGRFVGANEQLIAVLTKKVRLVTQGSNEQLKEIKTTEDVQQCEKELETINTWMNNSFASRQKSIQIHKKNIWTEGLKHDAFKKELTAYGSRLVEIKKQVEELWDNGYTNAHKSFGKAQERWNQLNIESEERSEFLEAVGMAVQVEREIEQFNEYFYMNDFLIECIRWLTQAEGQLRSVDQAAANGETSTINTRLKALKLLENTTIIQQETIDDIGGKAKGIETKEIRDAYASISQRYDKLKKDLNNVLVVANQQHQDRCITKSEDNSLAGLSSFEKDLQDYKNTYEQKMQQLAAQANEISNDSSVQAIFRHTLDDLKAKWKTLGAAFAVKEQKATAHKALDSWLHNAAELDGHISEREILISEEIIECDNILITKLKRDYEMAESDMEDMGRLLDRFIDLADALRRRFPEVFPMPEERRSEIRELVPLYAFLTENQDLCQCIESETIVASSTDTANDVEGIKAMLDQHSELWDDISARKRDLIEHEKNGGDLIAADHLAKKEVAEQLEKAVIAFNGLQEAWSRRNELLENAFETQKLLREYEQAASNFL
ncbi:unnamed protein product, partial [Mesorhabditis belari]|uniref:Uncharacterized protein n=1 Tax=Mesorhabditis belari TaxID=2138241 RepID=A0AAF3FCH6_9BILA